MGPFNAADVADVIISSDYFLKSCNNFFCLMTVKMN